MWERSYFSTGAWHLYWYHPIKQFKVKDTSQLLMTIKRIHIYFRELIFSSKINLFCLFFLIIPQIWQFLIKQEFIFQYLIFFKYNHVLTSFHIRLFSPFPSILHFTFILDFVHSFWCTSIHIVNIMIRT